ncbi:MAG: hypothetical protein NZ843_04965 [Fimbriimonadales bacterium]|nr:hypothetical protein [Fimbriimonadales bacterium]
MRTISRKMLLSVAALASMLLGLSLSACGSSGEEKQAEGYYEGPMQPKTERVGTPGQQQSGQ